MLALWIDEGIEEASKEIEKNSEEKKEKCACGRAVCCGKHKNGQYSCQKQQREHS